MDVRRRRAILCIAAFVGLFASTARAQERGFRLHRFEGTAAGTSQFLVERPWSADSRSWAAGLSFDGADRLLIPSTATGIDQTGPIISRALVGRVELAGALFQRLLLSASLPVTLLERGTPELLSGVAPLQAAALGDPRFGAAVRLLGDSEHEAFSAHLSIDVWSPIGAHATHQGDSGVRLLPRAVLAGAVGPSRWALDAGFLVRRYASYGPPALGMTAASEVQGGLSVQLALLQDRLLVGPEAKLGMQVVGANAFVPAGMSLEVLAGAHLLVADQLLVGLAGGTGFFGAPGTPEARALVRIGWAPRSNAPVSTATSEAPQPEVVVAPIDGAGTPESTSTGKVAVGSSPLPSLGSKSDADGDGLADAVDRCPYEPETKNGLRDDDGCPELDRPAEAPMTRLLAQETPKLGAAPTSPAPGERGLPPPDSDGDGLSDLQDRCPASPEDPDAFEDEDGCPEPDNDADGVADAADRCPDVAESANGVADEDGCPDLAEDSDKDGVADVADRCPFEPETVDGLRDDDGCPESGLPAQVALAKLVGAAPLGAPGARPQGGVAMGTGSQAAAADSDGDGVPDGEDRCPVTAEDLDGFEDEDGCPELDNDGDEVVDARDRCPSEAETVNGFQDEDGCPDEGADADHDGVDYQRDRCPLEPGDASDGCPHNPLPALALEGFSGAKGGPPASPGEPARAEVAGAADFDRDGLADAADACPMSAEDADDFEDEDGCPEPDNDRDGVADRGDRCPLEAETINGNKDADGCPDLGEAKVSIQGGEVVVNGVVRFRAGSASLERSALPLLGQVASVLKAAPSVSVEIQGHTDDVGNAAQNIKLSKRRAEAIRAVLVKAGVAAVRLVATGFGPTRPRATNETPAGREQNRRVEFLIIGETK